jgi:hypothetical protein
LSCSKFDLSHIHEDTAGKKSALKEICRQAFLLIKTLQLNAFDVFDVFDAFDALTRSLICIHDQIDVYESEVSSSKLVKYLL